MLRVLVPPRALFGHCTHHDLRSKFTLSRPQTSQKHLRNLSSIKSSSGLNRLRTIAKRLGMIPIHHVTLSETNAQHPVLKSKSTTSKPQPDLDNLLPQEKILHKPLTTTKNALLHGWRSYTLPWYHLRLSEFHSTNAILKSVNQQIRSMPNIFKQYSGLKSSARESLTL